jgi:hypothetical protein
MKNMLKRGTPVLAVVVLVALGYAHQATALTAR